MKKFREAMLAKQSYTERWFTYLNAWNNSLYENQNTPSYKTNHVSNLLAQLKKQDIVYCATPNIHKGKLYSLTDDGKTIYEYISSKE